jgi:hypothetical protein
LNNELQPVPLFLGLKKIFRLISAYILKALPANKFSGDFYTAHLYEKRVKTFSLKLALPLNRRSGKKVVDIKTHILQYLKLHLNFKRKKLLRLMVLPDRGGG